MLRPVPPTAVKAYMDAVSGAPPPALPARSDLPQPRARATGWVLTAPTTTRAAPVPRPQELDESHKLLAAARASERGGALEDAVR
jgi:hypothetical protein